jgi:hypothetical protein
VQRLRPRWWELVPEFLLLLGLAYFFVDEMDAATSAFGSRRAVALMLATVVVWLAARLLFSRFVRWPLARVAAFMVGAAAILAVVVVPAYRTHTVVERLQADPVPTATSAPNAPPAAVARPRLLRTGSFRGIDHRARGTVRIYERASGRHVVGLEDFDIQPGPDYDVYIVPGTDQTSRDGGSRLDDLRGNAGTQYYDAPAGLDLGSGPWTVLIWCQSFGVPVANAVPV